MRTLFIIIAIVILGTLTACDQQQSDPIAEILVSPSQVETTQTIAPTSTPTSTPVPPRVLTICVGQEPSSLFLYGDTTSTAQSIRQAIYDGPFDIYNFEIEPVILEQMPSLANGDAYLRPIEVQPGELILDNNGGWVALAEGVTYRPSGCTSSDCAVSYTGDQPVMLDELVVQFRLLPGIRWSDGTALTAADSVYSYQVLKSLYADVPSELIRYTQSYRAIDDLTVEWVGIPGYQSVYETHFLTPFPQHLWGALSSEELMVSEMTARMPLGWGAYVIDEWVSGDHISLSRNQQYFRANEGLPYFDHLVFRFSESPGAALDALLAGECDFVDRSANLNFEFDRVLELQDQNVVEAVFQSGTAWEQITFGIEHIDPLRSSLFSNREVRQAMAMCIDRETIANNLFNGEMLVPDTFVPVTHPLRNVDVEQYSFDPQTASDRLQFAGWIDHDLDPATPRISAGVSGIPDGTPLEFVFRVPDEAERPDVAQQISASLSQCGVRAKIELQEWESLLGPGPDGPVFGRQFDLAQFAWSYSIEPTCNLFQSSEIPGPYPEYSRGWGGGNASGFRHMEFDQMCTQARTSLPDDVGYREAFDRLQEIFAEELPVLPLYQRIKLVAMRPDMCEMQIDPAFGSALSHVEAFNYGENCE